MKKTLKKHSVFIFFAIITLFASFGGTEYVNAQTLQTIRIFVNNGDGTETLAFDIWEGQTLSQVPGLNLNPTRDGFTFIGWSVNIYEPLTYGAVITAFWQPAANVNVTFNLQGGNINGSTSNIVRTFPNGTLFQSNELPQNPVREGFIFEGWIPNIVNTNLTQNQTVEAVWSQTNAVVVTFNLGGGTSGGLSGPIVRTITAGTVFPSSELPQNPVRAGFTFAGWNYDIVGTTINQDIALNAQWIQGNAVTVTFNLAGGNISGNNANVVRTVGAGAVFQNNQMPQNPVRSGFTFVGWNYDIVGTTINQNTVVTAEWIQGNAVTVTFNLAGGNINGSSANIVRTIGQGTTFPNSEVPQNPVRPGFTFTGWNTNVGGVIIQQNTTVTAQWTQGYNATVTFNLTGGNISGYTTPVTRTVGIGQILPSTQMPPAPTRVGYTFNGWHPNVAGAIIQSNTTVNALWEPVGPTGPSLVTNVVTLAANGAVFIGNTPLVYNPDYFGVYHITSAGVSVLPARLSLAILFGLTPEEALTSDLLLWDAQTSTFIVDPYGRNIRLTVGSYTMSVGGVSVPILSGTGANVFPVSVFVDPTNGRMFLPTRAVADALGFTVGWNPELAAVTLTPPTNH